MPHAGIASRFNSVKCIAKPRSRKCILKRERDRDLETERERERERDWRQVMLRCCGLGLPLAAATTAAEVTLTC